MLYVMTFGWQPGLTREQRDGALGRRGQWQYPDGMAVLGEYWTVASDPAVVVVFEAADYSPLLDVGLAWGDIFQIAVHPAVTAEEGLRISPAAMDRRRV